MITEYKLTDKQRQKIAELRQKIFELEMQIASIYLIAPVRYITEREEECERVRKYFCYTDKPLKQGIVKINTSEVASDD